MDNDNKVIDTLSAGLLLAGSRAKKGSVSAVDDAGKFAVIEAKRRVPVDLGKLEEAITHDTAKESDGTVVGTVRIKENRKARKYAVKMHEGHYELGPKSQAKNNTEGVVVGRKYLERAITENEDELLKILAAEIQKALS